MKKNYRMLLDLQLGWFWPDNTKAFTILMKYFQIHILKYEDFRTQASYNLPMLKLHHERWTEWIFLKVFIFIFDVFLDRTPVTFYFATGGDKSICIIFVKTLELTHRFLFLKDACFLTLSQLSHEMPPFFLSLPRYALYQYWKCINSKMCKFYEN